MDLAQIKAATIRYKTFTPQVKAVDPKGSASFVVATLKTIDSDQDVTLPGFFGRQDVQMVPAHNWDHVPIGKGVISEQDDEAVVDAKFNLRIPEGQSWYEAVKFDFENPPALQEYSYAYKILAGGSKRGEFDGQEVRFLQPLDDGSPGVTVSEVSPVLKGAGVNTRTLAVKGQPQTFSEHADTVLADVGSLIDRATEVMALRAAKGKTISEGSADLLSALDAELERLKALFDSDAEPDTTIDGRDDLAREYARFVALTTQGATR